MRRFRFIVAVFVVSLAAASLTAFGARAQPPVWVVHGPHGALTLFGSVHLLPPSLDWEPARLKQAIGHANDLWFEIPINEQASTEAAQMAAARGYQPVGHTLSADLSPAVRARIAKAAADCGLAYDWLDHMRPWYAELALSVASYRQYGAGVENGVEQTLSAENQTAPRRAFETITEQIAFLSGASNAEQIASLTETLGELEEGPSVYKRLLAAWMAGDIAALQHEAIDPLIKQAPDEYQTLVVERNRKWMRLINQRLAGPGDAVMVVGVGHLVGPEGLPTLLRKEGFRVDGP